MEDLEFAWLSGRPCEVRLQKALKRPPAEAAAAPMATFEVQDAKQ